MENMNMNIMTAKARTKTKEDIFKSSEKCKKVLSIFNLLSWGLPEDVIMETFNISHDVLNLVKKQLPLFKKYNKEALKPIYEGSEGLRVCSEKIESLSDLVNSYA